MTDYPYLERYSVDEPDDVPAEVEIDEVQVRMECLRLVVTECKGASQDLAVLQIAGRFAAFVIHGTVPTTN